MLSIKCPTCGGTVQFDESHIATFCSFCGAHLPDMTDYVKKAAELDIQQRQHAMDMETMEKEAARRHMEQQFEIARLQNEIKQLKIQAKRNEDPRVKRARSSNIGIAITFIGMIIFMLVLFIGIKMH